MKNPLSNETVKSAAIVIGSAVAFILAAKGVGVLRKKFGGNDKVKAIFGSAENAFRADKYNSLAEAADRNIARRHSDVQCEDACQCERAG